MVPKVARRGSSFKGAGLYYLHDKREGMADMLSKNRVAWTHTVNLATDDPEFATRIMAATAMNKDELKKAAGVRLTGRKSNGDVYTYSLAWHPDEQGKFSKADMLQAADQSIKAIGAQEHQILIVAHNDEPHPHIHVIVNMVHPETGKALSTSNDYKKLDKWAHAYRRERGEEQKYCPRRAEKFNAIAAKERGEKVDFIHGGKPYPRSAVKDFEIVRQHAANEENFKAFEKSQREKNKALSDKGRDMTTRHKQEWAALAKEFREKKYEIRAQYRKEKKEFKSEIFELGRAQYIQMVRHHANQTHELKKKHESMREALQEEIKEVALPQHIDDESRRVLTKAFDVSSGTELETLNKKHLESIKHFRAEEKRILQEGLHGLEERSDKRMKSARHGFYTNREALIKRQGLERKDLQEQWKARNAQRSRNADTIKDKAKIEARTEKSYMEKEFEAARDQAKEQREKRNRRPRSRKRTRTE